MKMGRASEDTDQWPKVSLRDICLLFDSGVWGKAPGDDDRVYPVLRSNNIQNGEIDLSDVAIRAFSTTIPATKFLSSGDILVTKSSGSSSLVGKSAMVSHLDNASLFSNFVLRMRMNREVAVPSFIMHYLHTPQAGSAFVSRQQLSESE
jgi:restriction endonuclease S subunit